MVDVEVLEATDAFLHRDCVLIYKESRRVEAEAHFDVEHLDLSFTRVEGEQSLQEDKCLVISDLLEAFFICGQVERLQVNLGFLSDFFQRLRDIDLSLILLATSS